MSHPMVTFADAVAAIGTLPSLAPRPSATNIRALATDLIDKLTIIPSEQTADLVYSGLAKQDAVYALQTNTPWENFRNPGQVPPTNDAWTKEQSRVATNLHAAFTIRTVEVVIFHLTICITLSLMAELNLMFWMGCAFAHRNW